MISEELKAIVDKFKEQGKMNFFDETTEEKILAFEKEKEVTLPSKYKEWMLFSDGGELFLPAGVQLYGIEHKPLIDVNDNSRPSDDYIVMYNSSQLCVLNSNGSEKYFGSVDGTVKDFFKLGWNKYLLVMDTGVNVIKLS